MDTPVYSITPLYLGEMTDYETSMHTYSFGYGVKVQSPYLAFLIRGKDKNILVDTGPCDMETLRKYHSHVQAILPPEKHIVNVLKEEGLEPQDIDFIICTHLHWDHCHNNGCFPGKKVYVQKREVLYALNPLEIHQYTYESPQTGLIPPWIAAGNPLEIIDGDQEILPGITLLLTPGHTPGSQCVLINTTDGKYLIGGDTINLYDNWYGNEKYHHLAAGIHVNLEDCYKSFQKLDALSFKEVIPSHDMRVLAHPIYPAQGSTRY